MIFVTVGTQLPFDRLVAAVDDWAAEHPDADVFVQLGNSALQPRFCRYSRFTDPAEWEALFQQAERVVSHAGMGTIIKALDQGKPLIVMPRLAARGEHRNDHQVATAARFRHYPGVRVVEDAAGLARCLDEPLTAFQTEERSNERLASLLGAIRGFLQAPAG